MIRRDYNSNYNCNINWNRTKKISEIVSVWPAPYPADQSYSIGGIEGRRVRIACPVDVEVYDELGRLAARIINNVVDDDIDAFASIAASVEGDAKYFWFGDGEYTFKLAGTDTGLMDLEIADIDLASYETSEAKEFVNVTLSNGKLFETTIDTVDNTEVSNLDLYVVDQEGNCIAEVMEDGEEIPCTPFSIPATLSVNYKSTTSITFSGGKEPINWTSSDTSVATVDDDGNVTAVGKSGTAVITAKSTDRQSAECTVKVSMTIWQWIVYILFFGWLWGF